MVPSSREIISAFEQHDGPTLYVISTVNNDELSSLTTNTFFDRVLALHAVKCASNCPSTMPEHPIIWSSPELTARQLRMNSSLLFPFAPSPSTVQVTVNDTQKVAAYLPPEDLPSGRVPIHFVIKMVRCDSGPLKRPLELDDEISNKRLRLASPSVVRIGTHVVGTAPQDEDNWMDTYGALGNPQFSFLDLERLTSWTVPDPSPLIPLLERQTSVQNGGWRAVIHVPNITLKNFVLSFIACYYDSAIPDSRFSSFDISAAALKHSCSISIIIDISQVESDPETIREHMAQVIRTALKPLPGKYPACFAKPIRQITHRIGPHQLEDVLEYVKSMGYRVFMGILGYDSPALAAWSKYQRGDRTTPVHSVMEAVRLSFLEYDAIIRTFQDGPDSVITQTLYIGSSSSFAQSIGHQTFRMSDVSNAPEVSLAFGFSISDARECIRAYLAPITKRENARTAEDARAEFMATIAKDKHVFPAEEGDTLSAVAEDKVPLKGTVAAVANDEDALAKPDDPPEDAAAADALSTLVKADAAPPEAIVAALGKDDTPAVAKDDVVPKESDTLDADDYADALDDWDMVAFMKEDDAVDALLQRLQDWAGLYCLSDQPGSPLIIPSIRAGAFFHMMSQRGNFEKLVADEIGGQWGSSDWHLLETIAKRSPGEDAKTLAILLSGHSTLISPGPISLDRDGPIMQPDTVSSEVDQAARAGTIVKVMMDMGLVTRRPEATDDGSVVVVVPSKAISNLLKTKLSHNPVFVTNLKSFNGELEWFRDVGLSFYADRPIHDVKEIPESAFRNLIEVHLNVFTGPHVGSNIEVYCAIPELRLMMNNGSRNYIDLFVLARRLTEASENKGLTLIRRNFIIELKSCRLRYIFKGTFGRNGTAEELETLRKVLLAITQEEWNEFLAGIPPVDSTLDVKACKALSEARAQVCRDRRSPRHSFAKANELRPQDFYVDWTAVKKGYLTLEDYFLEAREQTVRYANAAKHGCMPNAVEQTGIDDPRVHCPKDNEARHKLSCVSIVLVGVVPVLDDAQGIISTGRVYRYQKSPQLQM